MNMKLWTHKTNAAAVGGSPSSAAAAAAAAVSARTKPAVEDQFKALVELTIQELTSARRELAAAVEEAKKMRAASAPTMPTHGNGNGNGSSRCRSLSSTWETTDSDDEGDDESDVEEYDDDDPMHLAAPGATTKQERDALLAAQRRALFMTDCDFDDDTEHEESKDEFFDLAHARDVASLARAASTNTLPILNRLMGNGSSSSSSTSANGEDATTATYPSALPAVRVSGRRRSNSRNRSRRRRTRSESAASGISNGSSSHNSSSSSSSSSHTGGLTRERRLRILSPIASKIFFSGWVRGQPAEVLWEVFDKSVQFVRIDVCNVDWKEPTIMARQEPNDGHFQWKKVVWGLPIKEGYYVNIYDATQPEDFYADGQLPLLAQSERFAVTG